MLIADPTLMNIFLEITVRRFPEEHLKEILETLGERTSEMEVH